MLTPLRAGSLAGTLPPAKQKNPQRLHIRTREIRLGPETRERVVRKKLRIKRVRLPPGRGSKRRIHNVRRPCERNYDGIVVAARRFYREMETL